MSIWVCLIGGPNDGQAHKVDDDQMQIVVTQSVPSPAARAFNRSFGLSDASTEIKKTIYTRRVLPVSGEDIVFFAIEAFSDLEALQHVLRP